MAKFNKNNGKGDENNADFKDLFGSALGLGAGAATIFSGGNNSAEIPPDSRFNQNYENGGYFEMPEETFGRHQARVDANIARNQNSPWMDMLTLAGNAAPGIANSLGDIKKNNNNNNDDTENVAGKAKNGRDGSQDFQSFTPGHSWELVEGDEQEEQSNTSNLMSMLNKFAMGGTVGSFAAPFDPKDPPGTAASKKKGATTSSVGVSSVGVSTASSGFGPALTAAMASAAKRGVILSERSRKAAIAADERVSTPYTVNDLYDTDPHIDAKGIPLKQQGVNEFNTPNNVVNNSGGNSYLGYNPSNSLETNIEGFSESWLQGKQVNKDGTYYDEKGIANFDPDKLYQIDDLRGNPSNIEEMSPERRKEYNNYRNARAGEIIKTYGVGNIRRGPVKNYTDSGKGSKQSMITQTRDDFNESLTRMKEWQKELDANGGTKFVNNEQKRQYNEFVNVLGGVPGEDIGISPTGELTAYFGDKNDIFNENSEFTHVGGGGYRKEFFPDRRQKDTLDEFPELSLRNKYSSYKQMFDDLDNSGYYGTFDANGYTRNSRRSPEKLQQYLSKRKK